MARGRDLAQDKPRDAAAQLPFNNLSQEPRDGVPNNRGRSGGAETPAPGANPRVVERERERTYDVRDSESLVLADIGTFRTLTIEDLTRYRYSGNHDQARNELRNLVRRGLIRARTTHPARAVYVALTRQGKRFLNRHRPDSVHASQVFYSRFVKPREMRHDAALYRLYQEAAQRIGREGGKIYRVVLDFELKKSINAKLARLRAFPETEREQRKRQIAEEHGLSVVNGKIPLPDLRLEYETADRDQTKVDLELATSDYHRDSLVAKVRAGFAIFAMREDAVPLRRAIGDPELTRDIFSI
jgi:DNA-binding PadR family transcriptional regulator